ncbi:MAG: ZIP family metal transporter [Candidatus Njordarchaeota archaeon]
MYFLIFIGSSLLAGLLATTVGGIPILFVKDSVHRRSFDIANGLAAGLMLAASIFSLLLPAFELGGLCSVIIGFIVGMLFVLFLKDRIHVFYYRISGKENSSEIHRALLIFIALTLHNIPEGMAVGVAFASRSMRLGVKVALAIGIQNIPEGFAVAAPMVAMGKYSKKKAFSFSIFSGIVEPLNAVLAYLLASAVSGLLPYLFGFCAGAMMFVVINEMIPEAQHGEYFDRSTLAILIGFLIMFILDVSL